MDLVSFMRSYAKELGGQFSEYDEHKSIIVIPLSQGRYQTIIGRLKAALGLQKQMIELSSKICKYKDSLDLVELLTENAHLNYAKFSIVDDYLKVEASAFAHNVVEVELKEMLLEVAEVADHWEQRLTGVDVH